MAMNDTEVAEYIAAYEAWWSASEVYNQLLVRTAEGDDEAGSLIETFVPQLDALYDEYIHKKQKLTSGG